MNTKMTKLTLAIGAIVMAASASAATDTATLAMSATVANVCAIGPGSISFGAIASSKALGGTIVSTNKDADSGSSIQIACTNGATAIINADGGTDSRKMTSAASDKLAYELYTDNTFGTVLDGSPTGSISYTGTGSTTTNTTIYARIAAGQLASAKAGTYVDTVGMTITYTP